MADECRPEELFFALLKQREEVDKLSESLLGGQFRTFGLLSHTVPNLKPAELGFLRSTAYLYVTYRESGRVGVSYLTGLLTTYGLDPAGQVVAHIADVDRLRTYLQHNLSPSNSGDRETLRACEEWMAQRCGSRRPATEAQWLMVLCALLRDAVAAEGALDGVVRAIEADESRDEMLQQWRFEFERYHGPEEFDRMVSEAASDMGYPHLDVVRLRKRFYERWQEKLRTLRSGYDFRQEARRLIEQSLLSDAAVGLPLTGRDILREFAVSPGPIVREGLEIAFQRFQQGPCSRQELIEHLRSVDYPNYRRSST